MIYSLKYEIGQTVYLITDKEQTKRVITGITIRPTGVIYDLAAGTANSWHYEMEITNEENVLVKVTNE